jgi:tctex1 domain-containing protein 2
MEAFGGQVPGPKQVIYENTYICQPEGYGEVGITLVVPIEACGHNRKYLREHYSQAFVAKQHKLRAVLKEVLKERMEKQQYDPVKGAQASVADLSPK